MDVQQSTGRRKRVTATLLVLAALAGGVVLSPPGSVADESGTPEGRADVLVEAAGLNPEVVPQLVDVSTEIESWTVELEEGVAGHQKAINDLEAELRPIVVEIDWLAARLDSLQSSVAGEDLTREVVAARDEVPKIEGALVELGSLRTSLEAEIALANEEVARSLEQVMVAWNLRQSVAQQFASVAEMENADLSRWPEVLRQRVENALVQAQEVIDTELQEATSDAASLIADLVDEALEEQMVRPEQAMIWPAIGAVNSGYGMRTHPVWGGRRMHTGIDVDADYGDDVVATLGGVVIRSGWNGGYGNAVEVDHGDGLSTVYAHLSELHVVVGDDVEQGETLGLIGATGTATDAHLHFEVRDDGADVDPMLYIP